MTLLCAVIILLKPRSCEFEADPSRRRRNRNRRRAARSVAGRRGGQQQRRLPSKGKEEDVVEDPGADGFINFCNVTVDGTKINTTITDLDYALITFDEGARGDGVKLELFQSLVSLDDSEITGLFKLETFDYDDPNSDDDADRITTLKTFSVAWSGC